MSKKQSSPKNTLEKKLKAVDKALEEVESGEVDEVEEDPVVEDYIPVADEELMEPEEEPEEEDKVDGFSFIPEEEI